MSFCKKKIRTGTKITKTKQNLSIKEKRNTLSRTNKQNQKSILFLLVQKTQNRHMKASYPFTLYIINRYANLINNIKLNLNQVVCQ